MMSTTHMDSVKFLQHMHNQLSIIGEDISLKEEYYYCPICQKEVLKEPLMALDGGKSGFDFYEQIIKFWTQKLKVGGAFHSPLMQPAKEELQAAIEKTQFAKPVCPVYQNVDAMPHTDPEEIKQNLIAQLTAPVRWTQIVENMLADGFAEFTEVGPGNVLQGLVTKVSREVKAESISTM